MIAVTGAAGFIGSAVISYLNRRGVYDIIAVDEKEKLDPLKRKNLKSIQFKIFQDKKEFLEGIKKHSPETVIHLGACSSTMSTDTDYVMSTNFEYSRRLCSFCIEKDVRFIYASSAATYGDGEEGFSDDHSLLEKYTPLNLYAISKHKFDLWLKEERLLDKVVGLKYFNVYGPNEYHKGNMRSFVIKAYNQIKKEGRVRLFKSYREDFKDGEQKRDFIYIKDAVKMTLFFLDNLKAAGIFNIGTSIPRSWNSLARSVFESMEIESDIEYIPMPEPIKDKYQYYTRADINKLRGSGFSFNPCSLEEGVKDYVLNYLQPGGLNPYLLCSE